MKYLCFYLLKKLKSFIHKSNFYSLYKFLDNESNERIKNEYNSKKKMSKLNN